MNRLGMLLAVCTMSLALGACGSDSSDDGASGSGGSAGGGSSATYVGSCDKPSHDTCIDYSCAGSSCDAYASEMQSDCDESWSTTQCKDGAIVRCQFSVSGLIAVTNYYDGDQADRENACNMGGGTVL